MTHARQSSHTEESLTGDKTKIPGNPPHIDPLYHSASRSGETRPGHFSNNVLHLLQALSSPYLTARLVHEHHVFDAPPAICEPFEDLKPCPSKDGYSSEPCHAVVKAIKQVVGDGPLHGR